jgi:hypothetical protein
LKFSQPDGEDFLMTFTPEWMLKETTGRQFNHQLWSMFSGEARSDVITIQQFSFQNLTQQEAEFSVGAL